MAISKQQREQVRKLFDGRCAYCGEPLGERWHADHVQPVRRINNYETVKKSNGSYILKSNFTGRLNQPQNESLQNYYPACVPCNLHKSDYSLEQWRVSLQKKTEELMRDSSAYRHAKRFGWVVETGVKVVFYFEKISN